MCLLLQYDNMQIEVCTIIYNNNNEIIIIADFGRSVVFASTTRHTVRVCNAAVVYSWGTPCT